MERFGHLKTMLIMAAADGGLAREELQLLSDRAIMWGLSPEQFEQALEEAKGMSVEINVPPLKSERMAMLTEVVRMMGADGVLHEEEKRLFAIIAAKMELSEDDVNQVIDDAIRQG